MRLLEAQYGFLVGFVLGVRVDELGLLVERFSRRLVRVALEAKRAGLGRMREFCPAAVHAEGLLAHC